VLIVGTRNKQVMVCLLVEVRNQRILKVAKLLRVEVKVKGVGLRLWQKALEL
jgi:hypothetical protein